MPDCKTIQLLETLKLLERRLSLMLVDNGLTLSQFRMLLQISKEPSIAASQLAIRLGITKASVSVQLKELQSTQLIETSHNPQDRRSSLISLSKQGNKRLSDAINNISIMENSLLGDLPSPIDKIFKQLKP